MVEFSGGERLTATLDGILKRASSAKEVDVGFLENSTYPSGEHVATIAAIQEFGAPRAGIPPRPFFRSTIANKGPEWPAAIAALLKANDYDAAKTLAQTGEAVKGQIQQSIIDLVSPPLAPATIARKGSSKPLVDTGHLLASVDYDVKT